MEATSRAIASRIQDIDITQQLRTCSFQNANSLVNQYEGDRPKYHQFRNVPSREKDRFTKAHLESLRRLTNILAVPAYITRTRYLQQLQNRLILILLHSTCENSLSASASSLRTNKPLARTSETYIVCSLQSKQHASSPGDRSRWAPGTPSERHSTSQRSPRYILRVSK